MALLGRKRSLLGFAVLATALTVSTISAASGAPPTEQAQPVSTQVVPKPVSATAGKGQFTLTRPARIVSDDAAVGNALAAYLRPATGYPLDVVAGDSDLRQGDIVLRLGDSGTPGDEGYKLDTDTHHVTVTAKTAHGLYNGVQTIRQLLPGWIDSPTEQVAPWHMPSVNITDYPRYGYRGVMLDIARHFQTPAAVKKLVDQVAAYKVNVLHLHVSDDQGFRIAINGFPNLTEIGGQGSVGTGGRTMDPGGFWTQAEYRDVVAYAAAHFMTVVPEVDSPGHNNAIIMSEYNDTANPLLNGNPQDINCSRNNPPVWNYTGAVGYSAMCPDSDNTWTILGAIIDQLTAMSPGPYYHLGGDEVPASLMSHDKYAQLVNQESGIVTSKGKAVMGWAEISGEGITPPAGSIAQYWSISSGGGSGTITARNAVAKGMKLVMSPANHAYLDMKYQAGSAGPPIPPTLGLSWACSRGCDIDQFYNWEPEGYVTGITDSSIIGVEAPMWGETVLNLDNVDYMVFPRVMAISEIGWSPKRASLPTAYADFQSRAAAQGVRLTVADTNFYPTPKVPWSLDLRAARVQAGSGGQFSGSLAYLSAPGRASGAITTTIDWGDGTTSSGTLSGEAATTISVNGLYTLGGDHTYSASGKYTVTITASANGTSPVTTTLNVEL